MRFERCHRWKLISTLQHTLLLFPFISEMPFYFTYYLLLVLFEPTRYSEGIELECPRNVNGVPYPPLSKLVDVNSAKLHELKDQEEKDKFEANRRSSTQSRMKNTYGNNFNVAKCLEVCCCSSTRRKLRGADGYFDGHINWKKGDTSSSSLTALPKSSHLHD